MKRAEDLNVPSLNGLLIAAGFGILAFAVAKVVGGFDYTTSGFFGFLVFAAAAIFLCIPWGARDRIPTPASDAGHADAAHGAVAAAPAASSATAAPVAAMAAAAAAATAPAKTNPAKADVAVLEPAAAAPAAKAGAAAPAAAKPAAKAKVGAAAAAKAEAAAPAGGEGTKPKALKAPRKGQPDDLKKIEGIGPALEKLCHELGIYHFDQIAAWGADEVAWMDSNLKGFKGRVTRDKWVAQAKLIAEVGMEEFLRRAKTNDY